PGPATAGTARTRVYPPPARAPHAEAVVRPIPPRPRPAPPEATPPTHPPSTAATESPPARPRIGPTRGLSWTPDRPDDLLRRTPSSDCGCPCSHPATGSGGTRRTHRCRRSLPRVAPLASETTTSSRDAPPRPFWCRAARPWPTRWLPDDYAHPRAPHPYRGWRHRLRRRPPRRPSSRTRPADWVCRRSGGTARTVPRGGSARRPPPCPPTSPPSATTAYPACPP